MQLAFPLAPHTHRKQRWSAMQPVVVPEASSILPSTDQSLQSDTAVGESVNLLPLSIIFLLLKFQRRHQTTPYTTTAKAWGPRARSTYPHFSLHIAHAGAKVFLRRLRNTPTGELGPRCPPGDAFQPSLPRGREARRSHLLRTSPPEASIPGTQTSPVQPCQPACQP